MLKSIIDVWRVKNRIFVHDETLKNIFGTNRLDELCKSTAMEIRVIRFIYGSQYCTDCELWFDF